MKYTFLAKAFLESKTIHEYLIAKDLSGIAQNKLLPQWVDAFAVYWLYKEHHALLWSAYAIANICFIAALTVACTAGHGIVVGIVVTTILAVMLSMLIAVVVFYNVYLQVFDINPSYLNLRTYRYNDVGGVFDKFGDLDNAISAFDEQELCEKDINAV